MNLAIPDESLMLRKAIGEVLHTGGKLFEPVRPSIQDPEPLAPARGADDPSDVAAPRRSPSSNTARPERHEARPSGYSCRHATPTAPTAT